MTIIQFIWVIWFLFTLLIVCIAIIELITKGIIFIDLDDVSKEEEFSVVKHNITVLICILYQLYFWLDYIGFWKEILK